MSYRVHVRVMPRAGLLDPQGQAVEHALGALGFGETRSVRVGFDSYVVWHHDTDLKGADLVLLDGNPLADIANIMTIRAVVANGHYFNRAALDQLSADARAARSKTPGP